MRLHWPKGQNRGRVSVVLKYNGSIGINSSIKCCKNNKLLLQYTAQSKKIKKTAKYCRTTVQCIKYLNLSFTFLPERTAAKIGQSESFQPPLHQPRFNGLIPREASCSVHFSSLCYFLSKFGNVGLRLQILFGILLCPLFGFPPVPFHKTYWVAIISKCNMLGYPTG